MAPLAVVPVLLLTATFQRHNTPADAGETITVPWRQISLVGAALVLFYMVGTAAATRGPVFLHTVHGLAVGSVAWATLPYLVATLAARIGAVMTGLVGSGNLRLGFAVPMVLILGILPLARQFATH